MGWDNFWTPSTFSYYVCHDKSEKIMWLGSTNTNPILENIYMYYVYIYMYIYNVFLYRKRIIIRTMIIDNSIIKIYAIVENVL